MLKLLTGSSVHIIQLKFLYVYILNVIDILFTLALLRTGLFKEANFLMVPVVESPLMSVIIKIVIPALLVTYVIASLNQLKEAHLPLASFFVNIPLLMYLFVTFLHIGYSFFFLYTVVL